MNRLSLLTYVKPSAHPERPIIIDDGVESPDTVTLRYEEEAVRVNGGDLHGGSATHLLPMAAYKTQPAQLHGELISWILRRTFFHEKALRLVQFLATNECSATT
jgi:hypothetical protein